MSKSKFKGRIDSTMINAGRWSRAAIFLVLSLSACSVLFGAVLPSRTASGKTESSAAGSHIIYQSPLPGSEYITPSSNIIIRSDEDISTGSVSQGLFDVTGSSSGVHDGKVILVNDDRTVLFQPSAPFSLGETVTVSLNPGLLSTSGDSITCASFSFEIAKTYLNDDYGLTENLHYGIPQVRDSATKGQVPSGAFASVSSEARTMADTSGLPADFPVLTVTQSNNPTPGFIFIGTNLSETTTDQYGDYLIIADNKGNPVFYRGLSVPGWDFTIQPTGVLTYGSNNNGLHYVMNTSLQVIDSITCGNGYLNDSHELRMLPNGDIFLLADDYENIDMSKIVPGGDSNAVVIGSVLQELDPQGDVIFQWRAIDHLKITDAIGQLLTQSVVDPYHCNAIAFDTDGNILLSVRHFSAIVKINVQTGDIMWQLGGKNNQFTFVDDSIGFSYQHSLRVLPNGDITLFDNGNLHNPPFSRALEYKLDETQKTATLMWQYRNNPDIFGQAMGNVQRLPDGNTFIGWGYDQGGRPAVTEVTPGGQIALELSLPYNVFSYRAYRFPFLLITSPVSGDTVGCGDEVTLRWNSSGVDSVNVDYSTDDGNSWVTSATDYPAINDSLNVSVPASADSVFEFRVAESGKMDDGLVFNSDPIPVGVTTGIESPSLPYSFNLSNNYPNPFNPSTTINYELAKMGHVTLKVYDILGRNVETLVNGVQGPGDYSVKFDGSRFASGVYFVRMMTADGFVTVRKMVLEK